MRLLLFGPGYSGARIAAAFAAHASVTTVGRTPPEDLDRQIAAATHIVSTVPPDGADDPVLARYGAALARSEARLIYLSSTGVYGDAAGGWVDETAPLLGRRSARIAADRAWQARGAIVLRLPGIYGPGRSVVDRLLAGEAHRVDLPDQVFSRVHVDDIVAAALAGASPDAPAGAYNIADDYPCAQATLVAYAAERLGLPVPPLLPPERAGLSAAALAFYAENRRVANDRAKRQLGWRPRYPDYRAGLRALIATSRPKSTSAPPATAVGVQR